MQSEDMFSIYVITSPDAVSDEASKIDRLLDMGVKYVHIRKPGSSLREVKDLIENISYRNRRKLRLHGHFELLNEMNLAGVHLNRRNPEAPYNALNVSASIHSVEEFRKAREFEYLTLSPVFDSISKSGYGAKFDLNKFDKASMPGNIVALGGVTPDKFLLLRDKGFSGAALLGYIWNNDFDTALNEIASRKSEL